MPRRKINSKFGSHGFVNLLLVALVIGLGILLSGAFFGPKDNIGDNIPATLMCCDSGNGSACHPLTGAGQTFTFNGQQYGLLKSNATMQEGNTHLRDSGQRFDGKPVILNSSDEYTYPPQNAPIECGKPGEDQIFNDSPPPNYFLIPGTTNKYCSSVKNDEFIYTCVKNCHPSACDAPIPTLSCYGDDTSVYNVYFRLADDPTPGIPDFVRNCKQTNINNAAVTTAPTVVVNTEPGKQNLQLQTLKLVYGIANTPFLSPYCKPAVYLYPQTTSLISVQVNSSQPFTYTDPIYPAGGWNVIADSNGLITYENKPYDYLYYETKVADSDLTKPRDGFVVKYNDLKNLFSNLLPKLGLNIKETKQFSDYWLGALPAANYYFVGIIPQSTLSNYSSLDINPKPATEIRVTLYFERLDSPKTVNEPVILTPKRSGFTVVEWGGIFKKYPGSKFSCVM